MRLAQVSGTSCTGLDSVGSAGINDPETSKLTLPLPRGLLLWEKVRLPPAALAEMAVGSGPQVLALSGSISTEVSDDVDEVRPSLSQPEARLSRFLLDCALGAPVIVDAARTTLPTPCQPAETADLPTLLPTLETLLRQFVRLLRRWMVLFGDLPSAAGACASALHCCCGTCVSPTLPTKLATASSIRCIRLSISVIIGLWFCFAKRSMRALWLCASANNISASAADQPVSGESPTARPPERWSARNALRP